MLDKHPNFISIVTGQVDISACIVAMGLEWAAQAFGCHGVSKYTAACTVHVSAVCIQGEK